MQITFHRLQYQQLYWQICMVLFFASACRVEKLVFENAAIKQHVSFSPHFCSRYPITRPVATVKTKNWQNFKLLHNSFLNIPESLIDESNECHSTIHQANTILLNKFSMILNDAPRVVIIGYPDHSNKGDAAIWVGERILLAHLGIPVVAIVSTLTDYNATKIRDRIGDDGVVLLHGGGNFGDLYVKQQSLRNAVVKDFRRHKIVSFPQSLYFEKRRTLEAVSKIYSSHPNLVLVARDHESRRVMKEHFSLARIHTTPDVAFMIGSLQHTNVKVDFLVHQREDRESGSVRYGRAFWQDLKNSTTRGVRSGKGVGFTIMDWIGIDPETVDQAIDLDRKAWLRVTAGVDFLSKGKVVITNRLHGHILMTLMGKKHVLLDNIYGKVNRYRRAWTINCPLGVKANNHSEAINLAKQLLEDGSNDQFL